MTLKQRNIQLEAEFNRRTDILNNHIAREQQLEKQIAELEGSLSAARSDRNRHIERVKTLEDALIYLGRTAQRHHSRIIEQALATKEPKVICTCFHCPDDPCTCAPVTAKDALNKPTENEPCASSKNNS